MTASLPSSARTHPTQAGADRRHRPRLRRPAAGRRVRARRLRRHRLRRRRVEDRRRSTRARATSPTCRARSSRPRVKPAGCAATTDMAQLGDDGRHRHLRADAAPQDARIPICRTSSWRSKRSRATLKPGQLVILESTTYPGTTDEVVQPMLEASGLKAGRRFLPRVFARARRSRATSSSHTKNIPKIVGGVGAVEHRGGRARSTASIVDTSCRSARRASPRW